MADRIVTARRRAIAEARLRELIPAASEAFGVPFAPITTIQRRYPDIHAAEVIENFVDFLQAAIEKQKGQTHHERPTNRRNERGTA